MASIIFVIGLFFLPIAPEFPEFLDNLEAPLRVNHNLRLYLGKVVSATVRRNLWKNP